MVGKKDDTVWRGQAIRLLICKRVIKRTVNQLFSVSFKAGVSKV